MKVVTDVSIHELQEMAVSMGMHADGEAYLLEDGSKQNDLWGINLHPDAYDSDNFIEFDLMIHIRPSQQHPSKDVLDKKVRDLIIAIIERTNHE
jgi:hypothetical protein